MESLLISWGSETKNDKAGPVIFCEEEFPPYYYQIEKENSTESYHEDKAPYSFQIPLTASRLPHLRAMYRNGDPYRQTNG